MHKLLQLERGGSDPTYRTMNWPLINDGIRRNYQKVQSYYRQYPQVVSSSHFLIRLIYALNIGKSLPLERFYYAAASRSLNTAMALKITTSISRGDVFDGIFYGKGSREVIIGHIDSFNYIDSFDTWREMESVRILHHPKSDLNLNIPDGRATSVETGLAVISINIPMLMVQYYHFHHEQEVRESQGMNRRSIMQFIHSYVLTNAVKSHLDYAIFNRMYNLQRGVPMGDSGIRHSFALVNYTSTLDDSLSTLSKSIDDMNYKFDAKLKNIPAVFNTTFATVTDLPDMAPTLQVFWALIASRIKVLSYLVRSASKYGARTISSSEINNIHRLIKIQNTDSVMRNILGYDAWFDISTDVDIVMGA